jgi:hypothetical protein
MDRCKGCGAHVNIASDHKPGCPTRPQPAPAGNVAFDVARGCWYSPDLSKGMVAMLIEDGSEWPISGDGIAKARDDAHLKASLLKIVDWDSLEDWEW